MADEHRSLQRIGVALMAAAAVAAVGAVVFGILGAGDGEPAASASPSPTPSASPSADPASFVTADGQDLMLNGKQFRYAGANAYTLIFSDPAIVDLYMKTAKDSNLSVMRTWGFTDIGTTDGDLAVEGSRHIYFQYWDAAAGKPAFNDGDTGLVHLDQVIASAQQHGIKLILPLVNNWTAFGGVDQYVSWAGGTNHDDFFTNPHIKQWYQEWVSHLLNRTNTVTGIKYKDDPTIMAWELGNELRCSSSGPYPSSAACSSDMMVSWADEMSTYLRSIDTHHLIGWGGEGFLCTDPGGEDWLTNCSQSADPVALLALPNIDIHGIHIYPDIWQPQQPTANLQDWGAWWIDTQGAIAADANKPYYIGEYGWVDLDNRMLVYDTWLQHFYDAGGDGSHFWLMQPASSISGPADSMGFTQKCPGPACDLVSNWSLHVGKDTPWTDFGPIAENDFVFANAKGVATIDVLANDKVYDPATFDLATIDLDPDTSGVQSSVTTDHGVFSVRSGIVTFTPSAGPASAKAFYTVADSQGRASTARQITVVPKG